MMTLTLPRRTLKTAPRTRPLTAASMPRESWLLRNPHRYEELLESGRRGIRLDELKGWLCPSIGASQAFRRLFRDESQQAIVWTEDGSWRIRVNGQAELRITRQMERALLHGYHLGRRERVTGTVVPGKSESFSLVRFASVQGLQTRADDDDEARYVERLVRDARARGESREVWEKEGSDGHRCLTYRRTITGGWDNQYMERMELQLRLPDGNWYTNREHVEERRGNRAVATEREWDERQHRYVTRCTERLVKVDAQGHPVVEVVEHQLAS
ncbi:MAG: hypothetical protein ACYCW6_16955 [Candidatus Xenobia bacterium]